MRLSRTRRAAARAGAREAPPSECGGGGDGRRPRSRCGSAPAAGGGSWRRCASRHADFGASRLDVRHSGRVSLAGGSPQRHAALRAAPRRHTSLRGVGAARTGDARHSPPPASEPCAQLEAASAASSSETAGRAVSKIGVGQPLRPPCAHTTTTAACQSSTCASSAPRGTSSWCARAEARVRTRTEQQPATAAAAH